MDTKTTTLTVEGMTCPSCIARVHRALGDLDDVSGIDVRLREGTVVVRHGGTADVSTLIEALREAGYESSPHP